MEAEKLSCTILYYKGAIILLCLSAVVHVVLITYVIDEKYEASALVLVRPREEIRFGSRESSKNILDFPLGVNAPHEAPSKTYTELIKSRALAEKIVYDLGLHGKSREPDQSYLKEMWQRLKDRAKEYSQQAWDILRYGRVIPPDPFNTTVKEVQKRISVKTTAKSYILEISCRWKNPVLARDIVDETAKVFVDFLAELYAGEAKDTREFVEHRLRKTEKELVEARQALRVFKEQNKSVLFTEETTEKVKMISSLETSLEKNKAELSGLLKQLTPSHSKVLKLQAEQDTLLESITQLKSELKGLPNKESRLATLQLKVKTEEDTYEFIKKEYEEARLREAKKTSDIGVVSPAILPTSPVKPIKIYYAGAAFFMALVLGMFFVITFAPMQVKLLSSIEELESALNLRVLATIPKYNLKEFEVFSVH
jgi:uncharacterized protein involved in exopolysaccharide biosynthesis